MRTILVLVALAAGCNDDRLTAVEQQVDISRNDLRVLFEYRAAYDTAMKGAQAEIESLRKAAAGAHAWWCDSVNCSRMEAGCMVLKAPGNVAPCAPARRAFCQVTTASCYASLDACILLGSQAPGSLCMGVE